MFKSLSSLSNVHPSQPPKSKYPAPLHHTTHLKHKPSDHQRESLSTIFDYKAVYGKKQEGMATEEDLKWKMKLIRNCHTQDPPVVNYDTWFMEERKTPTIKREPLKLERDYLGEEDFKYEGIFLVATGGLVFLRVFCKKGQKGIVRRGICVIFSS